MILLSLLFLDITCGAITFADDIQMCSMLQRDEELVAQCNSDNLQLLGKISQLEKFALDTLEKPAPTPTPLPINHQ